jgi:hypothetical protein
MSNQIVPRPPERFFEVVPLDSELFQVTLTWSPYDVIEAFNERGREISLAEAEEWLHNNGKYLKNAGIEAGYAVIQDRALDEEEDE